MVFYREERLIEIRREKEREREREREGGGWLSGSGGVNGRNLTSKFSIITSPS